MPRKRKALKTERRTIGGRALKVERRIVGGRECEVVSFVELEGKRRGTRYIGCPLEFFQAAVRTTKGQVALVLAQVIYRRCQVCKSRTITLPPDELAALGISRRTGHRALRQLQAIGLIRLHPIASGHKTRITLLWPPRAVYDEGASEV
jgi:hypothetical protein